MEAFEALNRTFSVPVNGYKGSLLVLPTGSGKTFTATNWISRSILSRNIKVLWLAQSSYLLDQATQSFINEASNIMHSRKTLNIPAFRRQYLPYHMMRLSRLMFQQYKLKAEFWTTSNRQV